MTANRYKISRFWLYYFFIRVFYLFFTIFVFQRFTSLGDTHRYLSRNISFTLRIFFDSTTFMDFFAGAVGTLFRQDMILSNFPAMLISFFTVRWVVEKLSLRKYVNNFFLMIMISLPNFSVWTSVWTKELFGLVFSAIIAVLVINFLNGQYKIKKIDILGLYLCFLFNPQYLPFIVQGLIFIYIARNFMNHKPMKQVKLAVIFLIINILFLYLIRDTVNAYAAIMHRHFDTATARATRDNIFIEDYDFFRHLPWGMFIAFFGPTLDEMMTNPAHAIAGLESLFIIILFFYLSKHVYIRGFFKSNVFPLVTISYIIIFVGICFIHYPFGVFNPGAAIRYRTRFIFLFTILLLYLYSYKDKYYLIGKKLCNHHRKRILMNA